MFWMKVITRKPDLAKKV